MLKNQFTIKIVYTTELDATDVKEALEEFAKEGDDTLTSFEVLESDEINVDEDDED